MSETKRDRHRALVDQKKGVTAQLEALRRERSAALISGGQFKASNRIIELNETAVALDEAIELADQIATADEEREHAAWRAGKKDEDIAAIRKAIDLYVKTTADIEEAANVLVAGLGRLNTIAVEMDGFAHAAGVGHVGEVQPQNIAMRISERLGRALSKIKGQAPGAYGRFRWMPEQPRPEDWTVEEEAIMSRAFAHVIRRLENEAADLRAKAATE